MMSIGKLAAGPGAGRTTSTRSRRAARTTTRARARRPACGGDGAAGLGLSGEVREEGLVRLLEGRDPVSGLFCARPARSSAVAGFDLTFRAPKSVSILFGIAEPDVARR